MQDTNRAIGTDLAIGQDHAVMVDPSHAKASDPKSGDVHKDVSVRKSDHASGAVLGNIDIARIASKP